MSMPEKLPRETNEHYAKRMHYAGRRASEIAKKLGWNKLQVYTAIFRGAV
jgi:hypothetical protein